MSHASCVPRTSIGSRPLFQPPPPFPLRNMPKKKMKALSGHFKYLIAQHYLAIEGRQTGIGVADILYRKRERGGWVTYRQGTCYCCCRCCCLLVVAKNGSVYIVATAVRALRNSSIKAFSMHFPDISAAYGESRKKSK